MAQDNRNRNQGDDQGQEWQGGNRPDDQVNREGRSSDSSRDQSGATRDQAEGEDMDEMDEDEDRDLDDRPEGGGNRRRSIG